MSDAEHRHEHALDEPSLAVVREFQANAPWDASDDPTSTKTIRRRYAAEMYRRFRSIKSVVREAVIEQDVFGLRDGTTPTVVQNADGSKVAANQKWPDVTGIGPEAPTAPYPGAFTFPTDDAKVDEFLEWLQEQVDAGVLEVTDSAGRRVAAHSGWQNTYIRSAYQRGVAHADLAMKEQGIADPPTDVLDAVFRKPMHADALGLLFTRSFNELEGVTDAMADEMARVLAEGLSQGWNPNRMARELNDRVDAVGLHRARMIARTETVRATNEAALNRYSEFDQRIEGVTVVAEYATAGDLRVCPECAALDGQIYSLSDARGVIPVHPNCRCFWLAVRGGQDPTVSPRGVPGDFRRGGVPVAPIRAVPDDEPDAPVRVNPVPEERVADWESFNETRIPRTAENRGMDPDEMVEEIEDRIAELTDPENSIVRRRAEYTDLEAILDDGRFKSQFETGTSGGALDTDYRAQFEEWMFGFEETNPVQSRPIYGYLDTRDEVTRSANFYGDVVFEFDDAIRSRTTIEFGDSLRSPGDRIFRLPRPLNDPDVAAIDITTIEPDSQWENFMSVDGIGDLRGYAEVQMHGGVSMDDVTKIIFTEREPTDRMIALLEENGIEWEVVTE